MIVFECLVNYGNYVLVVLVLKDIFVWVVSGLILIIFVIIIICVIVFRSFDWV